MKDLKQKEIICLTRVQTIKPKLKHNKSENLNKINSANNSIVYDNT